MNATIAAAQYPITEHATFEAWQLHVERWVAEAASEKANLLLFPEYGSMELVSIFNESIRSDIRGQVLELNVLKSEFCGTFEMLSRKYQVIIVAPSIPIVENDLHLNRVYVFGPGGLAGYQDKFFMTRFEDEHWGIQSAPKKLTVFEAEWGRFGIQICYDVEFSLGSQHLCAAGASLILAPSCTETIRGATRVHVGARARALENQAYTAVSQTVGDAHWSPAVDINYGYAAFYSTPDKDLPEEGIMAVMPAQQEGWLIHDLDFSKIEAVRRDGQVLNFKDHLNVASGFRAMDIQVQTVRI
ncbi:carbon-nitrogen hydrolase family protein [Dyadobacter sandarakinus]|uniref:Carbon-nitrogen hydrolase family protein n=1 Tax=Dyadobacter sandarakinus TaxID=2747268 RepID=A0ABX7IAX3_9BACT|nr:carbon-nitrogen hydrolase family protein [Dyadobacter sandarakinus]QRR03274.1 carbon-nitrogen hydrolase family protein [Dyadobacter sandarakinus]